MSLVALDELVREVRVGLDENAEQIPYMHGQYGENLELDELIKAKIVEAARDIVEKAPVESLDPVPMDTSATPSEYGGVLTVPEDFLRLVSLKMVGWNRSITILASEGSDIELMQRNAYTRGTKLKPVGVLSRNSAGKRIIEYFGASDTVEKALYIALPSIVFRDGIDFIAVSNLLRQSAVKRAIGLVLQSRGEIQLAASFLS
jgi:hypothetical protein